MRMGRRRTRQARATASANRHPFLAVFAGYVDDQNAVRHHDAGHHDEAHQRHDVQRGAGEEQEQNHAGDAGRNRQQDDERIDERGELRHQDEVDQHDGQKKSDAEALKRLLHGQDGTADLDAHIGRELGVA